MGSFKWRQRKRADGSKHEVGRAQVHDPRVPASVPKNLEKIFDPDKLGGRRAAKSAAMSWINEQESAVQNGTWRSKDQGAITLAEVVAQYRQHELGAKAQKTQVSYESILAPTGKAAEHKGKLSKPDALYIVNRWGSWRVDSITSEHIQCWVDALRARYQPQSVHNAYTVMRNILKFAVRRKYIASNPCTPDAISLPSKTRDRTGPAKQLPPEVDELFVIIDALPEFWQAPVWTDALLGLRAGELWGLTRADIDLLHGEVIVRQALKDVRGRLVVGSAKTDNGHRRVGIPDGCLAEIKTALTAPGVYLRGVKAPQAIQRATWRLVATPPWSMAHSATWRRPPILGACCSRPHRAAPSLREISTAGSSIRRSRQRWRPTSSTGPSTCARGPTGAPASPKRSWRSASTTCGISRPRSRSRRRAAVRSASR